MQTRSLLDCIGDWRSALSFCPSHRDRCRFAATLRVRGERANGPHGNDGDTKYSHLALTLLLMLYVGSAKGQSAKLPTGTVQDPTGAVSGQKADVAPVGAEGQRIAEAIRIDHPPRLDGTLDDPLWQKALPITDFKQREPYE